jgi:hypothetical protein
VTSAAPAVSAMPILSTRFAVSAKSEASVPMPAMSAASAVFAMSAVSSIYKHLHLLRLLYML